MSKLQEEMKCLTEDCGYSISMADVPLHSLDLGGSTALHIALANTTAGTEMIEMLLSNKANPNNPTDSGVVPLMIAIDRDLPAAVDALVKAGADCRVVDSKSNTLIQRAAGKQSIIDILQASDHGHEQSSC